MELNPPTALSAMTFDAALRLLAAAATGLLLGLDREVRGHNAGLRTHGLVCFAAAFLTVSAMALYYQLGGIETRIDPLRVIEGTAATIGVLAAALVVLSRGEVHNLTTAAHMWMTAVIGIAFGAGQYPLALSGVAIALVMITCLRLAERWLPRIEDDAKPINGTQAIRDAGDGQG